MTRFNISKLKNKIKQDKKNILYFILMLLPAVFVLTNRFSYLALSAFLILGVTGILFFFYKGKITKYHFIVDKILIILFFYLILSFLFSNQNIINLFSYKFLRYDGSIFFSYIAFFIFSVPFIKYEKASKFYFNIIFLVFIVFAIFGFYEYITKDYFFTVRVDFLMPMFVAANIAHNATGSAYAIISIFALAFFLYSEKLNKFLYFIVLIICFPALLMTKSRGSLIAFVITGFFMLLIYLKSFKKIIIAISTLSVALVSMIFITGTFERVLQIFTLKDNTFLTRLYFWKKAIYLFNQSPLFGVGFGRFNDIGFTVGAEVHLTGIPGVISFYTNKDFTFDESFAHNSYLHFLSETGIIGLALVLIFWITCFYLIFKSYKYIENKNLKKILFASLGGIIGLFILSITENYFTAPTVMMILSVSTSLSLGTAWEVQIRKKNLLLIKDSPNNL